MVEQANCLHDCLRESETQAVRAANSIVKVDPGQDLFEVGYMRKHFELGESYRTSPDRSDILGVSSTIEVTVQCCMDPLGLVNSNESLNNQSITCSSCEEVNTGTTETQDRLETSSVHAAVGAVGGSCSLEGDGQLERNSTNFQVHSSDTNPLTSVAETTCLVTPCSTHSSKSIDASDSVATHLDSPQSESCVVPEVNKVMESVLKRVIDCVQQVTEDDGTTDILRVAKTADDRNRDCLSPLSKVTPVCGVWIDKTDSDTVDPNAVQSASIQNLRSGPGGCNVETKKALPPDKCHACNKENQTASDAPTCKHTAEVNKHVDNGLTSTVAACTVNGFDVALSEDQTVHQDGIGSNICTVASQHDNPCVPSHRISEDMTSNIAASPTNQSKQSARNKECLSSPLDVKSCSNASAIIHHPVSANNDKEDKLDRSDCLEVMAKPSISLNHHTNIDESATIMSATSLTRPKQPGVVCSVTVPCADESGVRTAGDSSDTWTVLLNDDEQDGGEETAVNTHYMSHTLKVENDPVQCIANDCQNSSDHVSVDDRSGDYEGKKAGLKPAESETGQGQRGEANRGKAESTMTETVMQNCQNALSSLGKCISHEFPAHRAPVRSGQISESVKVKQKESDAHTDAETRDNENDSLSDGEVTGLAMGNGRQPLSILNKVSTTKSSNNRSQGSVQSGKDVGTHKYDRQRDTASLKCAIEENRQMADSELHKTSPSSTAMSETIQSKTRSVVQKHPVNEQSIKSSPPASAPKDQVKVITSKGVKELTTRDDHVLKATDISPAQNRSRKQMRTEINCQKRSESSEKSRSKTNTDKVIEHKKNKPVGHETVTKDSSKIDKSDPGYTSKTENVKSVSARVQSRTSKQMSSVSNGTKITIRTTVESTCEQKSYKLSESAIGSTLETPDRKGKVPEKAIKISNQLDHVNYSSKRETTKCTDDTSLERNSHKVDKSPVSRDDQSKAVIPRYSSSQRGKSSDRRSSSHGHETSDGSSPSSSSRSKSPSGLLPKKPSTRSNPHHHHHHHHHRHQHHHHTRHDMKSKTKSKHLSRNTHSKSDHGELLTIYLNRRKYRIHSQANAEKASISTVLKCNINSGMNRHEVIHQLKKRAVVVLDLLHMERVSPVAHVCFHDCPPRTRLVKVDSIDYTSTEASKCDSNLTHQQLDGQTSHTDNIAPQQPRPTGDSLNEEHLCKSNNRDDEHNIERVAEKSTLEAKDRSVGGRRPDATEKSPVEVVISSETSDLGEHIRCVHTSDAQESSRDIKLNVLSAETDTLSTVDVRAAKMSTLLNFKILESSSERHERQNEKRTRRFARKSTSLPSYKKRLTKIARASGLLKPWSSQPKTLTNDTEISPVANSLDPNTVGGGKNRKKSEDFEPILSSMNQELRDNSFTDTLPSVDDKKDPTFEVTHSCESDAASHLSPAFYTEDYIVEDMNTSDDGPLDLTCFTGHSTQDSVSTQVCLPTAGSESGFMTTQIDAVENDLNRASVNSDLTIPCDDEFGNALLPSLEIAQNSEDSSSAIASGDLLETVPLCSNEGDSVPLDELFLNDDASTIGGDDPEDTDDLPTDLSLYSSDIAERPSSVVAGSNSFQAPSEPSQEMEIAQLLTTMVDRINDEKRDETLYTASTTTADIDADSNQINDIPEEDLADIEETGMNLVIGDVLSLKDPTTHVSDPQLKHVLKLQKETWDGQPQEIANIQACSPGQPDQPRTVGDTSVSETFDVYSFTDDNDVALNLHSSASPVNRPVDDGYVSSVSHDERISPPVSGPAEMPPVLKSEKKSAHADPESGTTPSRMSPPTTRRKALRAAYTSTVTVTRRMAKNQKDTFDRSTSDDYLVGSYRKGHKKFMYGGLNSKPFRSKAPLKSHKRESSVSKPGKNRKDHPKSKGKKSSSAIIKIFNTRAHCRRVKSETDHKVTKANADATKEEDRVDAPMAESTEDSKKDVLKKISTGDEVVDTASYTDDERTFFSEVSEKPNVLIIKKRSKQLAKKQKSKLVKSSQGPEIGINTASENNEYVEEDLPTISPPTPKRRRHVTNRYCRTNPPISAPDDHIRKELPGHNWLEDKLRRSQEEKEMLAQNETKTEDFAEESKLIIDFDRSTPDEKSETEDATITDEQENSSRESQSGKLQDDDSDFEPEATTGVHNSTPTIIPDSPSTSANAFTKKETEVEKSEAREDISENPLDLGPRLIDSSDEGNPATVGNIVSAAVQFHVQSAAMASQLASRKTSPECATSLPIMPPPPKLTPVATSGKDTPTLSQSSRSAPVPKRGSNSVITNTSQASIASTALVETASPLVPLPSNTRVSIAPPPPLTHIHDSNAQATPAAHLPLPPLLSTPHPIAATSTEDVNPEVLGPPPLALQFSNASMPLSSPSNSRNAVPSLISVPSGQCNPRSGDYGMANFATDANPLHLRDVPLDESLVPQILVKNSSREFRSSQFNDTIPISTHLTSPPVLSHSEIRSPPTMPQLLARSPTTNMSPSGQVLQRRSSAHSGQLMIVSSPTNTAPMISEHLSPNTAPPGLKRPSLDTHASVVYGVAEPPVKITRVERLWPKSITRYPSPHAIPTPEAAPPLKDAAPVQFLPIPPAPVIDPSTADLNQLHEFVKSPNFRPSPCIPSHILKLEQDFQTQKKEFMELQQLAAEKDRERQEIDRKRKDMVQSLYNLDLARRKARNDIRYQRQGSTSLESPQDNDPCHRESISGPILMACSVDQSQAHALNLNSNIHTNIQETYNSGQDVNAIHTYPISKLSSNSDIQLGGRDGSNINHGPHFMHQPQHVQPSQLQKLPEIQHPQDIGRGGPVVMSSMHTGAPRQAPPPLMYRPGDDRISPVHSRQMPVPNQNRPQYMLKPRSSVSLPQPHRPPIPRQPPPAHTNYKRHSPTTPISANPPPAHQKKKIIIPTNKVPSSDVATMYSPRTTLTESPFVKHPTLHSSKSSQKQAHTVLSTQAQVQNRGGTSLSFPNERTVHVATLMPSNHDTANPCPDTVMSHVSVPRTNRLPPAAPTGVTSQHRPSLHPLPAENIPGYTSFNRVPASGSIAQQAGMVSQSADAHSIMHIYKSPANPNSTDSNTMYMTTISSRINSYSTPSVIQHAPLHPGVTTPTKYIGSNSNVAPVSGAISHCDAMQPPVQGIQNDNGMQQRNGQFSPLSPQFMQQSAAAPRDMRVMHHIPPPNITIRGMTAQQQNIPPPSYVSSGMPLVGPQMRCVSQINHAPSMQLPDISPSAIPQLERQRAPRRYHRSTSHQPVRNKAPKVNAIEHHIDLTSGTPSPAARAVSSPVNLASGTRSSSGPCESQSSNVSTAVVIEPMNPSIPLNSQEGGSSEAMILTSDAGSTENIRVSENLSSSLGKNDNATGVIRSEQIDANGSHVFSERAPSPSISSAIIIAPTEQNSPSDSSRCPTVSDIREGGRVDSSHMRNLVEISTSESLGRNETSANLSGVSVGSSSTVRPMSAHETSGEKLSEKQLDRSVSAPAGMDLSVGTETRKSITHSQNSMPTAEPTEILIPSEEHIFHGPESVEAGTVAARGSQEYVSRINMISADAIATATASLAKNRWTETSEPCSAQTTNDLPVKSVNDESLTQKVYNNPPPDAIQAPPVPSPVIPINSECHADKTNANDRRSPPALVCVETTKDNSTNKSIVPTSTDVTVFGPSSDDNDRPDSSVIITETTNTNEMLDNIESIASPSPQRISNNPTFIESSPRLDQQNASVNVSESHSLPPETVPMSTKSSESSLQSCMLDTVVKAPGPVLISPSMKPASDTLFTSAANRAAEIHPAPDGETGGSARPMDFSDLAPLTSPVKSPEQARMGSNVKPSSSHPQHQYSVPSSVSHTATSITPSNPGNTSGTRDSHGIAAHPPSSMPPPYRVKDSQAALANPTLQSTCQSSQGKQDILINVASGTGNVRTPTSDGIVSRESTTSISNNRISNGAIAPPKAPPPLMHDSPNDASLTCNLEPQSIKEHYPRHEASVVHTFEQAFESVGVSGDMVQVKACAPGSGQFTTLQTDSRNVVFVRTPTSHLVKGPQASTYGVPKTSAISHSHNIPPVTQHQSTSLENVNDISHPTPHSTIFSANPSPASKSHAVLSEQMNSSAVVNPMSHRHSGQDHSWPAVIHMPSNEVLIEQERQVRETMHNALAKRKSRNSCQVKTPAIPHPKQILSHPVNNYPPGAERSQQRTHVNLSTANSVSSEIPLSHMAQQGGSFHRPVLPPPQPSQIVTSQPVHIPRQSPPNVKGYRAATQVNIHQSAYPQHGFQQSTPLQNLAQIQASPNGPITQQLNFASESLNERARQKNLVGHNHLQPQLVSHPAASQRGMPLRYERPRFTPDNAHQLQPQPQLHHIRPQLLQQTQQQQQQQQQRPHNMGPQVERRRVSPIQSDYPPATLSAHMTQQPVFTLPQQQMSTPVRQVQRLPLQHRSTEPLSKEIHQQIQEMNALHMHEQHVKQQQHTEQQHVIQCPKQPQVPMYLVEKSVGHGNDGGNVVQPGGHAIVQYPSPQSHTISHNSRFPQQKAAPAEFVSIVEQPIPHAGAQTLVRPVQDFHPSNIRDQTVKNVHGPTPQREWSFQTFHPQSSGTNTNIAQMQSTQMRPLVAQRPMQLPPQQLNQGHMVHYQGSQVPHAIHQQHMQQQQQQQQQQSMLHYPMSAHMSEGDQQGASESGELKQSVEENIFGLSHATGARSASPPNPPPYTGPKCSQCDSSASYLCSGCESVWYCSQPCQTSAWDVHSGVCNRR